MTVALLFLCSIAFVIALGLWLASRQLPQSEAQVVVERINALLPQTQCGQCDYPGCRPYAEAIAQDQAPINQCPPGGQATIEQLAALLGREAPPLNPSNGVEKEALVAYIHEDICIGCKKCILACPVDAIMGTAKKMHTVIAAECTGCDLCVEPCPVDCIDMVPVADSLTQWRTPQPQRHRAS